MTPVSPIISRKSNKSSMRSTIIPVLSNSNSKLRLNSLTITGNGGGSYIYSPKFIDSVRSRVS
jgi:hypothetical protein